MTFSIAARCPETGMVGVAVSTAVICVGQLVPFPKAGVGAVATQSFVNPYIGFKGLDYLVSGMDAQSAMERLAAEDDGRDVRQFSVVDSSGRSAAYSGVQCVDWYGHQTGDGYAVAGNMLVGEPTITEMARAFEASAGQHLAERLVQALEAAQAAGGDKRGRISAALKVCHIEDYPLVDIRVDDHPDPVTELRRLWGLYQGDFAAFMRMMPSKAHPSGIYDNAELAGLLPDND